MVKSALKEKGEEKETKASKAKADANSDASKAKLDPQIQVNREEWNAKIKDLVIAKQK